MRKERLRYEKPVVMDLGITEGMGECLNGTLIVAPRCRTGGSPDEESSCNSGPAAIYGCTTGTVPVDCQSGALATYK